MLSILANLLLSNLLDFNEEATVEFTKQLLSHFDSDPLNIEKSHKFI